MPEVISVREFVEETSEDYKAPTTSSFSTRMTQCRNAVTALEEVTHTHTHRVQKETSVLDRDAVRRNRENR